MTMLAVITLASPWMLLALVALAAPLIAHRLRTRTAAPIVVPTLALLARARDAGRPRRRWRDLALLACRLITMAALVAAFARPAWVSSRDAATLSLASEGAERNADRPAGVVLLVDNSASAGQRVEGVEAIKLLRTLARQALGSLRPGIDRAALVTLAGRAATSLPEMSANIEALNDAADGLTAPCRGADVAGGLALAGQLLEREAGPRRVVILADLQQHDWAGARLPASLAGVQVAVVPLPGRAGPAANVAAASTRLNPANPVAGEPTELRVELRNFAATPAVLEVRATVDGSALAPQTVTIPARDAAAATFNLPPMSPGPHELAVMIPDDALAGDNAAHRVVHVRERRRVILLADQSPAAPGGAAFYLARALQPLGPEKGPANLRLLRPADLTSRDLFPPVPGDAPAVILGPVAALEAPAVELLAQHLVQGRPLAILAGEGPVDANLRALLARVGARAGALLARTSSNAPATLSLALPPAEDPLLVGFDASARHALTTIAFHPAWRWSPPPATTAPAGAIEPGLRFADDSPATLRLHIAASTGPQPAAITLINLGRLDAQEDFPRHGLFPALLRNLVAAIEPQDMDTAGPVAVGQALELSFAGNPTVVPNLTLATTDGRREPVTAAWRDGRWVVAAVADRPGFLELREGERLIDAAAAAFPAQESDLDALAPEALASQLGASAGPAEPASAVRVAAAPAAAGSSGGGERALPLWPALLLLALAGLAGEALLIGGRQR